MNTKTRSTVRSIIQQQVSLAFTLNGEAIPRQSTTIREIPNGIVTIRGETNLSGGAWATYQGIHGEWVSAISRSGRVGQPGVTFIDALGVTR